MKVAVKNYRKSQLRGDPPQEKTVAFGCYQGRRVFYEHSSQRFSKEQTDVRARELGEKS